MDKAYSLGGPSAETPRQGDPLERQVTLSAPAPAGAAAGEPMYAAGGAAARAPVGEPQRPESQRAEIGEPERPRVDEASGGTTEEIARRAYELYVARGSADGGDLDDWLEAERQCRAEHPRG